MARRRGGRRPPLRGKFYVKKYSDLMPPRNIVFVFVRSKCKQMPFGATLSSEFIKKVECLKTWILTYRGTYRGTYRATYRATYRDRSLAPCARAWGGGVWGARGGFLLMEKGVFKRGEGCIQYTSIITFPPHLHGRCFEMVV